jgi:hypothetical protein
MRAASFYEKSQALHPASCPKMPTYPQIFAHQVVTYPAGKVEWGACGMVDVLDVPADVLNFREEAKGCFLLAQAETDRQVRIILMGMAVGWLKLANHTTPSEALQLEPADRNG